MTIDLKDYDYELPPELIAQRPAESRGTSRLMVVDRSDGRLTMASFGEIGRFLPPGALLVLNDAKVTPARLLGRRPGQPGRVELLILDPPLAAGPGPVDCWCLGKPGRRIRPGTALIFSKGDEELEGEVLEAEQGGGRRLVRLHFRDRPSSVLESLGHVPLPPYIKRPDGAEDLERYQTVYARSPGAVAAPTAGLHFTAEHLSDLRAGHETAAISLIVGAGTFAPLGPRELSLGRLHEERAEVGEAVAEAVREARRRGSRVAAVGTTAARALEWAAEDGPVAPRKGLCDLFIKPGHRFRAVEALITNFHLPSSSLILLAAAFAGRPLLMKAYELAVKEKFRFYSYGDAMLIL